jgi:chromosome segregation ATPase
MAKGTRERRAAAEWEAASRYYAAEADALDAREAGLVARERRLARAEADAAGLREEAAALERRVANARAVLADLEARRDRARADLVAPPDLPPADHPLQQLHLDRERGELAARRSELDGERADLDDRRRLAAEQLAELADARVRWAAAERRTVAEMEGLARELCRREAEQDARERRLIRADARRRADAYDLWRQRLELEGWRAKLAAREARVETAGPSAEAAALRAELERLAAAVIALDLPEPPDRAADADPDVVPFPGDARAA